MSTTEMVVLPRHDDQMVRAEDFMPLMTVEQAVQRKSMINQFIGQVLKAGEDYGDIPGASKKKVLLKPGAEKLCSIFGMAPTYGKETVIEDWTGADHDGEALFYYEYRCQLSRGGRFCGEAIGSCNSWESKYRYRWVSQEAAVQAVGSRWEDLPSRGGQKTIFEPQFAIDKAETSGKYGKPGTYWEMWQDAIERKTATAGRKMMGKKEYEGWFLSMDETQYRIPNPDIADVINTCQKMAQKRSLVAAVLVVTNCSDAFTQDVEDFHEMPSAPVEPELHQPEPQNEVPANLPKEIAALFQKTVPAGATGKAFEFVKREIATVLPQNGEDEYRRILGLNGIKQDSKPTHAQSRTAIMQLWTMAQSLRRVQPKKPDGLRLVSEDDLGINMSDMPNV